MIHRPSNSDYWEHDLDDERLWEYDPEYGSHWFMRPCENFDDVARAPNEEIST